MEPDRGKNKPKNAWNVPNPKVNPSSGSKPRGQATGQHSKEKERAEAERRFQAAKAKLEQSVHKHLSAEQDANSSDEEDLQSENILGSVLQSYTKSAGGLVDLGRTQQFLEDAFQSGAATCLICISSVKRADAIWSCEKCYCFFHLPCIQRWAADSVAQQKRSIEDLAPYDKPPELFWGWNMNRVKHHNDTSASVDKWRIHLFIYGWYLIHVARLAASLCYQNVATSVCCFVIQVPVHHVHKWSVAVAIVGRAQLSNEDVRIKNGLVEQVARKLLVVPSTSVQKFVMTAHASLALAPVNSIVHAGLKSGSNLVLCLPGSVELFVDVACHAVTTHVQKYAIQQESVETVLSQNRALVPVGRSPIQVCLAPLMPLRVETLVARCWPVAPILCCDGQCPPCEKICGKMLGCGKHKCNAICHTGPCYPCPLTEILACPCGDTRLVLPCGRRKHLKPPKCNKPCRVPTECHHPSRVPHKCHPGDCPPCKQTCGKVHVSCKHTCPAPCHSAVWVTTVLNADKPLAGPWEKRETIQEMKDLPCPSCMVMRQRTGHVIKVSLVRVDVPVAGENCSVCESTCTLPRPQGCTHTCLSACHPSPCKPCQQAVKLKCHCGLNQLHRPCVQWTKAQSVEDSKQEIEKLLSCGNQCPKNHDCGHRCREVCHSGECPDPQLCQRKVKVTCPCKRLRKEFTCEAVRSNKAEVSCDDVCRAKQREDKLLREQQEQQHRQELERKEQEELEKFEKWQQGKKKHRERRRRFSDTNEPTLWQKYGKICIAVVALALVLGFAYNIISD
ncbi:hypothetical protein B566_EDAN011778 [Ephemera danica]|nr:hypothetical protein B566_EDAN011778 [Ephemera danica]